MRLRHEAAPDFRQDRQGRAPVAIQLDVTRRRHGFQRILHAGIVTPEVAEAAIFRIDHDNMTDLRLQRFVERNVSGGLGCNRARVKEITAAQRQSGEASQADASGKQATAYGIMGQIGRGSFVAGIVSVAHRSSWMSGGSSMCLLMKLNDVAK